MVKNANPVYGVCWMKIAVIAALVLGAASGCERNQTAVADASPKSVADFFEIRVGDKPVRMQLAVREDEMQRGLMERRDLGPDDGMLFVYARPQRMSFWMRNTPTPLDIGFFDQTGTLMEIYQLHPFDENSVSSQSGQLALALEMNQGWFRQSGVKPGARLDMKAVAVALKARGFRPEQYGLRD
jgi:uncharacterized membrane protein (UPF0127 family)